MVQLDESYQIATNSPIILRGSMNISYGIITTTPHG